MIRGFSHKYIQKQEIKIRFSTINTKNSSDTSKRQKNQGGNLKAALLISKELKKELKEGLKKELFRSRRNSKGR
jgi:hypothetical protein